MRQAVGAGLDRRARRLHLLDVNDGELAASVRGLDDRLQGRTVQAAGPGAGRIDDLDVVRALGDPRGHPGVGLGGPGQRRDRKAVLGAVAVRRGR